MSDNERTTNRFERHREERRKYENDVYYDVWSRGGNPDNINDDRVEDRFWGGSSASHAAEHELHIQQEATRSRRDERTQQEDLEAQQAMMEFHDRIREPSCTPEE